jgi:ubiquinone/menaquinone biosynthesis C-methylase UbiE
MISDKNHDSLTSSSSPSRSDSENQRQAEVSRTSNPRTRFSTRVDNYVKYRPGYPTAVVNLAISDCGLKQDSVVADIGSGTGILSELFLKNGNPVFGVEPNQQMRDAAERLLSWYPLFSSVNGAAEATTLGDNAIDVVIAAQAFHWFDQNRARVEFARILKPEGWVILIWNERRLTQTNFLRDLENLLLKYGTDYSLVRHENVAGEIASFYAPALFRFASFENFQEMDYEGLQGRVLSASYTPEPGHRNYEAMLSDLNAIFRTHQVHGKVTIEYDTRVYFGHLNQ